MDQDKDRIIDWTRRLIARGYQPTTTWDTTAEYVPGPYEHSSERGAVLRGQHLSPPDVVSIGVLVPTYVSRDGWEAQAAFVMQVLSQVSEIQRTLSTVRPVFLLGMQWFEDGEAAEARFRLELANQFADDCAVEFLGLCLKGPGKIRTLNAAIALADKMRFKGLLWVDDDILLAPQCLVRLVEAFVVRRNSEGAVGATKTLQPGRTATSRALSRCKQLMQSSMNFPHGCCMLVQTSLLAGGIPNRYQSDDVYVCFRLLSPSSQNPLLHMELVANACCTYGSAGGMLARIKKLRRILLNQHVFLADWPRETAVCYFKNIMFPGLWPINAFDRSNGPVLGVAKMGLQWLYFSLFLLFGMELLLRGFAATPLRRVGWN